MSKSSRRSRYRQAGVSGLTTSGHGSLWRLAADPPVDPSRIALARLAMIEWHHAHGSCVSRTARHFGWSRPTIYRWLARYDPLRLAMLEDRPSRPRRCRRSTWTLDEWRAVKAMRERYPRWGKAKLSVLLGREGSRLSVSMTGRILTRLRDQGELVEPERGVRTRRARRRTRPHATRKPRGHAIERPGDLIGLDTLEIRLPGDPHPYKQFTARDVVSRWDVLELGRRASAAGAVAILDALEARMPFVVRAIQVDNGSEFMADFEAECARRGIALFVLPPRSPKLNGHVERANGTHRREFWEVTDTVPELEPLRAALLEWEACYNHVRPHQALGYLTPAEWLDRNG